MCARWVRGRIREVAHTVDGVLEWYLGDYLRAVFRSWRRYARNISARLASRKQWYDREWFRIVFLQWYGAVRGKWRTRVIVSNWARIQTTNQMVSPWFFKWVSITAHDRHVKRQVVVEAALTGRLAALERERDTAAFAGPERIGRGPDQRAIQMAKLEVELRRSESRVAAHVQQVKKLEQELATSPNSRSASPSRQMRARATHNRYF